MGIEEIIKETIEQAASGVLPKRVVEYADYKVPHIILRDSVVVTVELTCGKVVKIDVTDVALQKIRGTDAEANTER